MTQSRLRFHQFNTLKSVEMRKVPLSAYLLWRMFQVIVPLSEIMWGAFQKPVGQPTSPKLQKTNKMLVVRIEGIKRSWIGKTNKCLLRMCMFLSKYLFNNFQAPEIQHWTKQITIHVGHFSYYFLMNIFLMFSFIIF